MKDWIEAWKQVRLEKARNTRTIKFEFNWLDVVSAALVIFLFWKGTFR